MHTSPVEESSRVVAVPQIEFDVSVSARKEIVYSQKGVFATNKLPLLPTHRSSWLEALHDFFGVRKVVHRAHCAAAGNVGQAEDVCIVVAIRLLQSTVATLYGTHLRDTQRGGSDTLRGVTHPSNVASNS
eukprot:960808-Prorocentrum_minimum.AAC.1